MDLGLKGRTAIVCGASSGLGLAIGRGARATRARTSSMFARRRDVLEREAERIGALAVRGDVTNPRDLEALVTPPSRRSAASTSWSGTAAARRPAARGRHRPPSSSRRPSSCCFCLPSASSSSACLISSRASGGRIVLFTSLAVLEPSPHLALSNAVRPGVVGLGEDAFSRARADGDHGQLHRARPDRHRAAGAALSGRPDRGDLAVDPARRARERPQFGDVACFLASDRARYVTGPHRRRRRFLRGASSKPMSRALSPFRLASAGLIILAVALVILVTRGSNKYLEVPDRRIRSNRWCTSRAETPGRRRRHLLRRRPAQGRRRCSSRSFPSFAPRART